MRVIRMNPFPPDLEPAAAPPAPFVPTAYSPPPPSPLFNIKNFKRDDWIILGIIATLILEGSDDYILLCALGYLFIMGL